MFSGVFSGTDIYAIEFDDEANTLTLVDNITSNGDSSKWIAIDERKQNLYVGNLAQFDSYSITSSTGLEYASTVNITGGCSNANYILASPSSPYVVFGAPYSSGCPVQMMSVDPTGTLTSVIASATYNTNASIHGLALSPDNAFLYSADDPGNAIWVHSINMGSGTITPVQYLPAPTDANPRHLIVHPGGGYAYVIFEEGNAVGVYARDEETGELTFTDVTYPLLPSSFSNSSSYWADEIQFSYSPSSPATPRYMYAATRSRTSTVPGYVSAFELDITTGAILEQLFLVETTGSGGVANSVTSALFSEEYFAITDSEGAFVEVWKLVVDGAGDGAVSAEAVVHLGLGSGPSDVVWVD